MRRGGWLGLGAVLGAAATVWSRRRISELSDSARAGEMPGEVLRLVKGGSRRLERRLSVAVDAGRDQARRRQGELRRSFEPHP